MQTYDAPPGRNAHVNASAPPPERRPAMPQGLTQAPALAVVSAPQGAPSPEPSGAYCKPTPGFTTTQLMPGKV